MKAAAAAEFEGVAWILPNLVSSSRPPYYYYQPPHTIRQIGQKISSTTLCLTKIVFTKLRKELFALLLYITQDPQQQLRSSQLCSTAHPPHTFRQICRRISFGVWRQKKRLGLAPGDLECLAPPQPIRRTTILNYPSLITIVSNLVVEVFVKGCFRCWGHCEFVS